MTFTSWVLQGRLDFYFPTLMQFEFKSGQISKVVGDSFRMFYRFLSCFNFFLYLYRFNSLFHHHFVGWFSHLLLKFAKNVWECMAKCSLVGGSVLRPTDTKETAAVSRSHSRVHRRNKELRARKPYKDVRNTQPNRHGWLPEWRRNASVSLAF